MILDNNLVFDPANTAITVTADSTNSLDLKNNRDLGVGRSQVKVLTICDTTFTSATASATMNIQLFAAPDNGGVAGTFNLIGETGTQKLGQLQAGYKLAEFDVPPIGNSLVPVATPTLTTTASSTSATVSSATGIVQGLVIVSSGLVPGTTVSSISGTTVTLSTAAATTTTAVASAFMGFDSAPYRFLKLTYTCSNTMTAGKLESYLTAQGIDVFSAYPAGVAVAN